MHSFAPFYILKISENFGLSLRFFPQFHGRVILELSENSGYLCASSSKRTLSTTKIVVFGRSSANGFAEPGSDVDISIQACDVQFAV